MRIFGLVGRGRAWARGVALRALTPVMRRFDRWWRPPRRLIPTRPGWFLLGAPFVLGVAAINATNNLLFLLLGLCLGLLVLSGLASEKNLRRVEVSLWVDGPAHAGEELRFGLGLTRSDGAPAYAIRLRERLEFGEIRDSAERLDVTVPIVRGTARRLIGRRFVRRGRHHLGRFELMTGYPFGLFHKVRDLDLDLDVTVWPPRMDVPVELSDPRGLSAEGRSDGSQGLGLDIYGLRERLEWDPEHRIHAMRSLAIGRDVVVETETLHRPVATIGLANAEGADPEAFERAVALAGALAIAWDELGYSVRLVTLDDEVPAGASRAALLDRLALVGPVPGGAELDGAPLWLVPVGARVGIGPEVGWVEVKAEGAPALAGRIAEAA